MSNGVRDIPVTVIEPVKSWGFIDLRELSNFRDLLYFLVWRNVKVQYAQSIGGFAWAVISPAIQILLFTIVFGVGLEINTGGIPYALFLTVAMVPWTYLSGAMTQASNSLVLNAHLLGKTYFPRVIFPLTAVLSGLVDFSISLILIVGVMLWYQVPLTLNLLILPVVVLMMVALPLAVGLWLSSLAIRYRDVRIGMGHFLRALMWTAPIIYTSSEIPAYIRPYYILNPIVGVIEGYRSSLIGEPIYWDSLIAGAVVTFVLVITGAIYFRKMERIIVDVI